MRGSCSGDKYSAFLSSSLFYSKVHLSLIADLETSTKTPYSMLRFLVFLTVQHFVSIKFFAVPFDDCSNNSVQ